jgi:hypothetical protein
MVKARRIIRRKGSDVAVAVGKVREFDNLSSLAKFTRKQHKVFAFMVDNGSQGTMRSGRMMRWCDLHVRNVVDSRLFQSPGEQLELF